MKKESYILASVLSIGILGASALIWMQNMPVTLAQGPLSLINNENIKEPIDPDTDYIGLYELYARNGCEEQGISGDYSNNCLNIIDRIVADETKFVQEQLIIDRKARRSTSANLFKKSSIGSQEGQVVEKPRPVGIPGIRFTNDPQVMSCHLKEDNHPSKSSTKGRHYDEDCCIDKDEWLEPGCTYLYSDLGVSLNGKKTAPPFVRAHK